MPALLLSLLIACGPPPAPPPSEPPPGSHAEQRARRPALPEGGLKPMSEAPLDDPAAMLAACEDRVEGPSKPRECSTDADCARAGCSSEVCVSQAEAPNVMTTCEVLPCFAALGTCGCHEGTCSWTPRAADPGQAADPSQAAPPADQPPGPQVPG